MKFKPGTSGNYNGRPKGSPNKNNYYDVQTKLIEMGHDPLEAIINLAQDPNIDPVLRFRANQELLSKIAPSVKAIEQRPDSKVEADIEMIKAFKRLCEEHKKEF